MSTGHEIIKFRKTGITSDQCNIHNQIDAHFNKKLQDKQQNQNSISDSLSIFIRNNEKSFY